ncbi:MAG: hydantoinase/oxoprolinase family protein [Deltaproteobacteria bacterium]|nr:hydantoinase/oxoprolinase family protein [Deltaproteobacteria bacterium]
MNFRISLDAGGTFTDGVLFMEERGQALTAKAHTTPRDPSIGTLNCIAKLAEQAGMDRRALLAQTATIVHGTTLATNVVATRSGAKMGTIATKGFRLRMVMQQVAKSDWVEKPVDMYDFRLDPPAPLTRNFLMTEVEERVNARGEVLTPLNEETVRRAVRHLKDHQVEAIAVLLLFSPLYPLHEKRIAEIIEEEFPGVYVALSSTVLPVIGEFDRWSTTMFSAYVAPAVAGYVTRIREILKKEGFGGQLLFMQSNGGTATPEIIVENPASLLLSGPAAGPSLGRALGLTHDFKNILSVDMGGTSFDVGVVHDGLVDVKQMQVIDWKKFCLPTVDVSAVGAGGGSIAYIDGTGRLQVGPQSAGASPGPACYDQGGEEPTVTDANMLLGYLDPDYFLGGEVKLRKDLAEKAIQEKIAAPLGITATAAAAAIYDIINARMASGTDVTFTKRGYDPRDFTLCAAGGAAPVHAVPIMEELGIRKLIIPKVAPTYCAFGMLFSDLRHDFQRTYVSETVHADLERINGLYAEMEALARETLQREGISPAQMTIEKAMEIKYYGQFRQRLAKAPAGPVTPETLQMTVADFHENHRAALGYADPKYPTEIVRLHLTGRAHLPQPQLGAAAQSGGGDPSLALKGKRAAYFTGQGFVDTEVYAGEGLGSGAILRGPCIIEERFTTLVVPPGTTTQIDVNGNFLITREED